MNPHPGFLYPDWPAPASVRAACTLRTGGVSQAPFDSFNVADHVNDAPEHIAANRELLKKSLNLPNDPIWLNQTHSTIVVDACVENRHKEADAAFTKTTNQVCVVLTADCLPILLCNTKGTIVAAIHGGWRGLLNGVIENTVTAIHQPGETWLAWLGPAISAAHFEVGHEVRDQFLLKYPDSISAFTPSPQGRWMADLFAIARLLLLKSGVSSVYGGEYCTFANPDKFYSYRRDGNQTGRIASLVWITS